MTKEVSQRPKSKKIFIPMILLIVGILGGSIYWYIDYSKYIRTDDAHVESESVAVSSKILGRISKLYADEGDSVKKGMLMAILDSTDLVSQKEQVIAAKSQMESTIGQAEARYQLDIRNLKVLEVSMAKAKDDFDRASLQVKGDVITQEQFEHAKRGLEMATAQYEAAKAQIKVSTASIANAKAAVESVDAQIKVIDTQLINTRLYAPTDGLVAKRWLLPGDVAQAGQSIFTLINQDHLWVSVFLEETKLDGLRIGQSVQFSIDSYPDVTFTGKILTLGSNTAAQFSLIPANNASGNFTKVTQRVQLKVSIEGTKEGRSLANYRILSGMSAVVKIVK